MYGVWEQKTIKTFRRDCENGENGRKNEEGFCF